MDRRIARTKKAIKQEFLKLLSKEELSKISITDIANAVDINRSTFYLHYPSIDVLINEIEDDIINDICSICEEKHDGPIPLTIAVANYVRDNVEIIKPIVDNIETHFFNRLSKRVSIYVERTFANEIKGDRNLKRYLLNFIFSGAIGTFKMWIDENCASDPLRIIYNFGLAFKSIIK